MVPKVLDAHSFESGRRQQIKKTLNMLAQLFGGRELQQQNLQSFVFSITKASEARTPLKFLQNRVVKLSVSKGVPLEECRE